MRISLYANAGGPPYLGALLDTVTFSVGPNLATALYAVSSSTNPILSAGTPYWIVASMVESSGRAYWANVSPQGNSLPAYFNFGAGGTVVGPAGQYPTAAFRISTAAIAPEPGSLALAAVGGAGLILVARRRRGS